MSECVRRVGDAKLPPTQGRAVQMGVGWLVRMTMVLSTLIAAEPLKRTRRSRVRARSSKVFDWSVAFRNLFS